MLRRIEAVEVAEQEARGVADAAIRIGDALQDFVRHRHLVAVIGRRDPQAQHVGAEFFIDLLRLDAVAERLRHLAALRIDGETVRQHFVVRRAAVHRDRRQQRGLEPAAMLIGAFEIHHLVAGFAREIRALIEHAEMRDARIEPDVEDVGDLS